MTENYEPTSDEVIDELGGPSAPAPDSWVAEVLGVVAARERLIKRHNFATGGYVPAPTPPSTPGGVYRATEGPHTYTLNLSPLDRELLQRIIDQRITFDHQGERP